MSRDFPLLKENTCYGRGELELVQARLNFKKDGDGNIGIIYKTFPWLQNFFQFALKTNMEENVENFHNTIFYFLREVSVSMEECWKRPTRAGLLKFLIKEIYMFFHSIYQRIKQCPSASAHCVYLEIMTDLAATYIDLEVLVLRRNSLKAKNTLLETLFLLLDNSEDHIAEAFLKSKSITKVNEKICTPVLMEFLIHGKFKIMKEDNYLRFIFLFKLWRTISTNSNEKIKINWLAITKLNPSKNIVRSVRNMEWIHPLLPKIHHKNNINFLLMNLKFDFHNIKREFLKRYGLSNKYKNKLEFMEFIHPLDLSFDTQFNLPGHHSSKEKNQMNQNIASQANYLESGSELCEEENFSKCKEFENQDGKKNSINTTRVTTNPFHCGLNEQEHQKSGLYCEEDKIILDVNGNQEESKPKMKSLCIHYCSGECSQGIQTLPILRQKVAEMSQKELKPSSEIKKVEYQNLAKCYKIVKSKSLKIGMISIGCQTEEQTSVKKLNFSSKVVRVSEEELLGTKPKDRMKSWRTERRERLEEEKRKKEGWVKVNERNMEEDRKGKIGSPETKMEEKTESDSFLSCCDLEEFAQFDQHVLEKIESEASLGVGDSSTPSSSDFQTPSSTAEEEFPEFFNSLFDGSQDLSLSDSNDNDLLSYDEKNETGVTSSMILDCGEFEEDYFGSTKDMSKEEFQINFEHDFYNTGNVGISEEYDSLFIL